MIIFILDSERNKECIWFYVCIFCVCVAPMQSGYFSKRKFYLFGTLGRSYFEFLKRLPSN